MTRFYKVTKSQFIADGGDGKEYDGITLPRRSTAGSAGYDFFAPSTFTVKAGESVKIATGIRAQMDEGRVLAIFPRSSLGFKYRLTLDNTVGIIDADYFGADNEGHIMLKMTNNGANDLTVEKGKAFAQGVFLSFFVTDDDDATEKRTGGLGSTDNYKAK